MAIFAIIDLLLFLLGVDFSVSGWITEQIGKLIFHFELTIDTDVDTGSPDLRLQDVNGGMVNGAIMDASIPVTTTITHVDPDGFWSWRVTPYLPVFYTRDYLRSTTFKYTLSNSEALFNVGRDAMKGEWGSVVVDHEYLSKDMYRATNVATPSANVTLQTGINVSPPLYLNNSYAIPGIECWTVPIFGFWVPICVNKTIDGKGSSDIGSSIVFDVLPETLDGFVALDWGGSIPFPTQADWDNDGLRSIALNGNDPDDFDWDSDDDRLSDAYELKMRENGTPLKPLSADSDLDGLSDFDEMRYGTNPGLLDTDRDGLLDSQEVWHLDTISGNWEGGWDFTTYYTDTNDVISQTLTVHIFSDPLKSDADNDGITDGVEKVLNELDPASYPFHPAVFNETPVALYLAFSDEDGFVGLNQNFTISATVKNNLSSPLYAKGNLGLTLPPQIGDAQLTQEFNIFQAQASSIITDVTVSNSGRQWTLFRHSRLLHAPAQRRSELEICLADRPSGRFGHIYRR